MLTPLKFKRPIPQPDARERTLAAIQKYKDVTVELERICKERGMPVPISVC